MGKRILLVGDSIRMGYAPLVRERMSGEAIIVEIPKNGGDSGNLVRRLPRWLKKAKSRALDIIHFNCGLHDIKRQFEATRNQQPIERYEKNVEALLAMLREKTRATLIWATTTPVIYERHHAVKGFDRHEVDVESYNKIATKIMETAGIPINDLNGVITRDSIEDCIKEDGVHMTSRGNELLARAVVDFLEQYS
ncbi:MAG: SGNH/GDSL hydrolase family protein [Promethearchaeota archaeon]